MERCIHKYVTKYLIEHSIITPFQSDFQAGDSTIDQLLYLCNEISNALDNALYLGTPALHNIYK